MFGAPIKRDGKSKACDYKVSGDYVCEKFTNSPKPLALAMLQAPTQR